MKKRIILSIILSLMVALVSPAVSTAHAAAPSWDRQRVPHYNQKEYPWKQLPYWGTTVWKAGCGPCSMAAAVSGITGRTVTPKQLLAAKANGVSAPMLSYVKRHYGVQSQPIAKTTQAYTNALKSGKMIWVTIKGTCSSGQYRTTVGGHYILLYGYSAGKCKIMDSNGVVGDLMSDKYCIKVSDAANWRQSSQRPFALWGTRAPLADDDEALCPLYVASASGVTDKLYTGREVRPAPVVKLGGRTLVNGVDYTLSYKNNKAVGYATVTIKGQGDYTGTLYRSFRILPRPTSLIRVTAGKKSFTARWKKQPTQTTGYQIQYSRNSRFTSGNKSIYINRNSTVSRKVSKLYARKRYYVRVRAYKKVGKTYYYSAWSKAKSVKTKR